MTLITRKERILRLLRTILIISLILGVITFVGIRLYPMFHGPELSFETIAPYMHVTEPMIRIQGTAHYTQRLVIQGKEIPLSPDGAFDTYFLLDNGYNLLVIDAYDRFHKKITQSYPLTLEEKSSSLEEKLSDS